MKKLTKSKTFSLILSIGIAVGVIVPSSISLAKDDDIGYKFLITQYKQNSTSAHRYRQTTNTQNPWKVRVTDSDEPGGKTYTRFWLIGYPVSIGSKSVAFNVLEDNGYYYNFPYESANQSDVRLQAENNNFNNSVYWTEGHWDEEIF